MHVRSVRCIASISALFAVAASAASAQSFSNYRRVSKGAVEGGDREFQRTCALRTGSAMASLIAAIIFPPLVVLTGGMSSSGMRRSSSEDGMLRALCLMEVAWSEGGAFAPGSVRKEFGDVCDSDLMRNLEQR